jgi:hypothetical protein
MYFVSDAFSAAAEARTREILVKATFNGTTELTGANIIDLTISEAVNTSDGLSMGATIAKKLTMRIKMPNTPLPLSGGVVEPYVGFNGVDGYCPMGKYYITEVTTSDDYATVSISGYDAFSKTEEAYAPTITLPASIPDVLADIAAQCGFEIDPGADLNVTVQGSEGFRVGDTGTLLVNASINADGVLVLGFVPSLTDRGVLTPSNAGSEYTTLDVKIGMYDLTCRQYIGYIAGLLGKNAKFTRDGLLTFTWYQDYGRSIPRDAQYMNGFTRLTSDDFNVRSITSGTSDNVIVAGSGVGISFENPWMTQEILDSIFSKIKQTSYTPAQIKWRGNPMIEAGDIVVADDKNGVSHAIYVMEQTLKIGGGMHSEIKSYGKSDAEIAFSTSPQAKKLQQLYTTLQSAISEATKLLNGANGGVFEIIDGDGDGVNDGWIIRTLDRLQHIKANVNGIGITTDGGATYKEAITPAGINASVITAGQMNAERITVGDASLGDVFEVGMDADGHPVITIGSSASSIKQKQTSDAITFVNGDDDQVAKFSVAGAEWDDMQEMKYCGFVWTKSPATGNVRFTKVGE